MASSSSSRSRNRGLRFDMRSIYYEPEFVPDTFKGNPFCDKALKVIADTDLKVFTKLPRIAYDRVVKEFYRKFSISDDDSGKPRVTVKIDGNEYSFGAKDVAKALGIQRYKPVKYETNDVDMMKELNKRPRNNKKNEVRESFLDENFWVVSKFIRAYACPFIHGNELPLYVRRYWHSLYKRNVIDVPRLVIDMMDKSLHSGRKMNMHGLAMPRTITAILKTIGYKFLANEVYVDLFPNFNYNKVQKSLYALGVRNKLIDPPQSKKKTTNQSVPDDDDDDELGDDMQEDPQQGEPSHAAPQYQEPPQGAWESYSRTRDEWQHGIDAKLQGFGQTMDSMHTMMQGYGPILQGIGSSVQSLDTRVGALETKVDGLQTQFGGFHKQVDGLEGQMDDLTYEQHEIYHLQRLSIQQNYGETTANQFFNEAIEFADSAEPRRRRRKCPFGRGGPMD